MTNLKLHCTVGTGSFSVAKKFCFIDDHYILVFVWKCMFVFACVCVWAVFHPVLPNSALNASKPTAQLVIPELWG